MSLVLLNLQSNQLIKLDKENPLIIGRGNVQGVRLKLQKICFDKRVSRNHGKITCTVDGKIRLLALHLNPCFFTRNGVPPVLQLNKDEEEVLSEGDCLGLLPNAYWFQVKLCSEIKVKEEPKETDSKNIEINNDDSIVNDKLPDNGFTANDPVVHEKGSSNSNPNPKIEIDSNSLAGTSNTIGNPEFEKTRRLPLWMYEIDESIDSNKSPNKHKLINNEDSQNKRQRVMPEIKKEPNVKSEGDTEVEDKVVVAETASTSNLENVDVPSSMPETQIDSDSAAQVEGEPSSVTHKAGYEATVNRSPTKRSICQYEGNCYRKNMQHKLEFSHPGDADYVPYEARPVCQYGAGCYRRNERHRIEYRHPLPGTSSSISPPTRTDNSLASSPLPAKRKRKVVKKQNLASEDEYDLEDPFINDASSDEWVPSEGDSEDEEPENFDTTQEW